MKGWLFTKEMELGVFYFIVVLTVLYLVPETSGAVVNINLQKFVDGVLMVPENQGEGRIEVQLSEAVNSMNATVNCISLETAPGLTAVQFASMLASVNTTRLNVTFRILSAGKPVAIQCSAQSQGNGTQFRSSESRGNTGLLQVTKAPTVHICPDVVLLQKYRPKSVFQVQFSETIHQFPVRVRCSTVKPDAGAPQGLQISFAETFVGINQRTAEVSYEIVSLGVPVQVICRAQSTIETEPILPTQPAVSTPLIVFSSTVNQTASVSVNETSIVSVNGLSSLTFDTSAVTSVMSVSSVIATASPGGASRKRRRRSILSSTDRTMIQYRFNTSAGPAVTFALDLSPLRILPLTGFIRAPNGSLSAVLTLDQPAENTVDITCSLDVVLPSDVLRNTQGNCSQSVPDKVILANNSVEIQLSEKEIQFQKNEGFKIIKLILSGSPSQRAESLVRLTCCGQSTGLSLRYANETAVAFVWVEVRELHPVDWDGITSGQRKTTLVSDIDLTCPCNLKENSCDAGCCCDQDCGEFESGSSICISGFFGGATSERPFEFSCQASWPDSKTWHPFLCVTIDNSPLTGYFFNFTSPSIALDSATFNTLAGTKNREPFSFEERDQSQTTISGGLYTAGSTIKTAATAADANYAGATLGVLSLPQIVFNRLCSQTAPVRFLKEFSSRCVLELDETLCNSQSPWSALNYLMPLGLSRPACSLPPAVLARAPPELASSEVLYYCGDISPYVTMTTGSMTSNSSSLFDGPSMEIPMLQRCAFDDGETLPPSPTFDRTSRTCSNVVVKVEYEFKWRERQVDAVTAKITLGIVQLPSLQPKSGLATSDSFANTLGQIFSVKFLHSPRLNASTISQIPFQRSGNPGYVRGLPVVSRNLDNSSGQVRSGKIQLWSPGPNSLCADSALTPVLYGEDAFSGCLLRLSLDDMRNCSSLRELVLTNQNRLIQATDIGRRGNAKLNSSNDWLPVIREPIANNVETSSEEGNCPGILSGLIIEMLVTDAGKYGGVPQMEIVGTRIRLQYSTWHFKCVSGFGLSCFIINDTDAGSSHVLPSPSLTSSAVEPSVSENPVNHSISPVNLTAGLSATPFPSLLMTQTTSSSAAEVASPPVISTVNFSITQTANLSNISTASSPVTPEASVSAATGSKVNNTGTRQYEPRFQYFMVTSSVVFIKVPAEKPQRVKRTVDQSGICYRDVCKEELFFPLTTAYQGESREKTLALSLLLIFLALVTYAVTRPWG